MKIEKKEGLQKLTDFDIKVEMLLALPKIEAKHLEELSPFEKKSLMEKVSQIYNSLKGEEKDRFYSKVEALLSQRDKNEIWEMNHLNITDTINRLMEQTGRMPPKSLIAKETGLSRLTIHKHLKDYQSNPIFRQQLEQFRFMIPQLLSRIYTQAANGDMRAAKLYFEIVGDLNSESNNTIIKNQNNDININSLVINQETIRQLPANELKQLQEILKIDLI